MVKSKVKRPLAVNLIVAWLIFLPIMNYSILIYAESQPPIESTPKIETINITETIPSDDSYYVQVNNFETNKCLVSINSDDVIYIYLVDRYGMQNFTEGIDFEYYEGSKEWGARAIDYSVYLSANEWYFVFYSANPTSIELIGSISCEPSAFPRELAYPSYSYPSILPIISIILIIFYFHGIRSLWRMQNNWDWMIYGVLGINIIINLLSFVWWGFDLFYWVDWIVIGQIIGSSSAIYWRYTNRNLFVEVQPKKSK